MSPNFALIHQVVFVRLFTREKMRKHESNAKARIKTRFSRVASAPNVALMFEQFPIRVRWSRGLPGKNLVTYVKVIGNLR